MALRYFALLVAACLQLSQAHIYEHPSQVTSAGSLKTNWAAPESAAWNQPAPIQAIPQASAYASAYLGPYASSLSAALAPRRTVAGTRPVPAACPGAERSWNTPAPVPYSIERNWNTPAYPPGSLNPAIPWTEQYWVNPAPVPTLLVTPELAAVTPQESNWSNWSGQNAAHTWNVAAPEIAALTPQEANWNSWTGQNAAHSWNVGAPAGACAADHTTIQLPAPIELPAPRALPKAPVLPGPIPLPAVHQSLALRPTSTAPHLASAPYLPAPIQLHALQRYPGPISAQWLY